MHAVIVVPGIMGTELFLPGSASAADEKIWPPTALETQFGYKRRDKLASPRAVPGQIITNVLCLISISLSSTTFRISASSRMERKND